jgi:hypothetical protein
MSRTVSERDEFVEIRGIKYVLFGREVSPAEFDVAVARNVRFGRKKAMLESF